MSASSPTLVRTDAQLDALCRALETLDRVGVDTEFHAERRYRPQLLLVQLAADDGRTWLVDPLAVDPAPLAEALSRPTWVAFAADTDAALLHRLGARPTTLLDPQRLAGLVGHGFPRSLADLCAAELDVPVDKAPAMSDWSRRPLADHQLRYAALDAVLALRLWDALAARASEERRAWAEAEGRAILDAAGAPADPDARWRRLRVAPRLDDAARSALHRLSAWREALAAAEDQPPWSLLSDGLMLDLARRPPRSLGELAGHRRVPRRLIKSHGSTVLHLVQAEAGAPIPPPIRPDRAVRAAALRTWSHAAGASAGIAPLLLLPEDVLDAVAEEGEACLTGWRRAVCGAPLAAFFAGRSALQWGPGGLVLT